MVEDGRWDRRIIRGFPIVRLKLSHRLVVFFNHLPAAGRPVPRLRSNVETAIACLLEHLPERLHPSCRGAQIANGPKLRY